MKVLIAEDDKYTREGLRDILENEGYFVIMAENGEEALKLFIKEKPDFMCLDIMMPKMNGYDVCREIRKQGSNIPMIFISAKSEEIDKVLGLELGADDFIVKPFGVKEVVARIRAITRRVMQNSKHNQTLDEFSFGPYVIFPKEFMATKNDLKIDLNYRDIKILQILKENHTTIVKREVLFKKCWNMDFVPNSRTLDQHIAQLRKKIDDPKDPQLIITVHGMGYRYGPSELFSM